MRNRVLDSLNRYSTGDIESGAIVSSTPSPPANADSATATAKPPSDKS